MRAAPMLSLALLLGACQSLPVSVPPVALPAGWAQQRGSSASLADRPFDEVFAVPELNALIEAALSGSSELIVAVERVELARAQQGLTAAARLPALNASGALSRQRAPGAHPSANVIGEGASLSLVMPAWEIDLWGRLAARDEIARRELLASAALAQGVRISVVAQVATLYLDLLDLDGQTAISRRTLLGRQQSLRLTRARFDEGIASLLDVRQAESLLASTEQAMADQRRRIAQAENALSTLIGRHAGPISRSLSLEELDARLGAVEADAGLPAELLQRRPDIRAAEESLRGAGANVELARKAYLPSLSLGSTLGLASPALGQLFDSGRHAWAIQPAIGLATFDGGRLRAGVALAEAQQRILLEQYRVSIRQAFREVSDALAALEALGAQRTAAQQVVLANRERLRITNARYRSGISSYFEVLDAERQLFDSEVALSQLLRSRYQALVQLYRVLGGGWRDPPR